MVVENGYDNLLPATPSDFGFLKGKRLILDPSHAYYSGGQHAITEFIRKYNPNHFHISDSDGNRNHLPFGEGKIDFSFVNHLEGYAVIEVRGGGMSSLSSDSSAGTHAKRGSRTRTRSKTA